MQDIAVGRRRAKIDPFDMAIGKDNVCSLRLGSLIGSVIYFLPGRMVGIVHERAAAERHYAARGDVKEIPRVLIADDNIEDHFFRTGGFDVREFANPIGLLTGNEVCIED